MFGLIEHVERRQPTEHPAELLLFEALFDHEVEHRRRAGQQKERVADEVHAHVQGQKEGR